MSSFNMTFFMKDDVKDKMPKSLIPLDVMVNWDGVLKFSGTLEGDRVTHFLCCIEKPIT